VLVSDESLTALRSAVAARRAVERAEAPVAPAARKSPAVSAPAQPAAAPSASTPSASAERAGGASRPIASGAASIPLPTPFELPAGDKAARWAALRERVLADAVCCGHVRPGKQVVFGVGSIDAKIMFVGEAPGAEEEMQGEPFVGPAGQLLTKMITGMGLKRSDVYIGNIMNWRPEMPLDPSGVQYGNRAPTEVEMSYCLPYLKAQIEIVNPAVLVALGSTATQALLGFGSFKALGDVRGRWHEFVGRPLMVTYHPSYILRNQSNRSKRMIWEDLLKVMERAGLPVSEKQRTFFLDRT
jgi:DNA polymerase